MSKYQINIKNMDNVQDLILYSLTSNDDGSVRYFKTSTLASSAIELSEADYEVEIAQGIVTFEVTHNNQGTGRFKHFYNDTDYDIEVLSSGLSNFEGTRLYYVTDKDTGHSFFFKTTTAHPEGIALTNEEGLDLATNGGLTEIINEPKNTILLNFSGLLAAHL